MKRLPAFLAPGTYCLPVPLQVGYTPRMGVDDLNALRGALGRAELARSTIRAYQRAWRDFDLFCASHSVSSMPALPETVAQFLAEYGTLRRPSTLAQAAAGLAHFHHKAAQPNPCDSDDVKSVLDGHRRLLGARPEQSRPILSSDIRAICRVLDEEGNALARRDKALLLLGFAGGFRRSELVAIDFEHIEKNSRGVLILVPRSKADPNGLGHVKGIPFGHHPDTCPVRAFEAWQQVLRDRGLDLRGPVFRPMHHLGVAATAPSRAGPSRLNDKAVNRILQKRCSQIGLNVRRDRYTAHSLRAGMITQAGLNGASPIDIAQQSGHASLDMILRYTRRTDKFQRNAAGRLDL